MIKTSIRNILTGKLRESVTYIPTDSVMTWHDERKEVTPEFKEHHFYLFLDGDLALYLGQSSNVLRVTEDRAWGCGGVVGRLIELNFPMAHDWLVAFFTKEEVVNSINNRRAQKGLCQYPSSQFTEEEVKTALIQRYNPCLNLAYRPSKRSLPPTYILPPCEIPDGLIHKSLYGIDKDLMPKWDVSYRTFDYETMDNAQYKKTVYAPNYNACLNAITEVLGYSPDNLRISQEEKMSAEK